MKSWRVPPVFYCWKQELKAGGILFRVSSACSMIYVCIFFWNISSQISIYHKKKDSTFESYNFWKNNILWPEYIGHKRSFQSTIHYFWTSDFWILVVENDYFPKQSYVHIAFTLYIGQEYTSSSIWHGFYIEPMMCWRRVCFPPWLRRFDHNFIEKMIPWKKFSCNKTIHNYNGENILKR